MRSREGWLMIDHRASPGIPKDFVFPPGFDAPRVPEGRVLETITQTCSHCAGVVVTNLDRMRDRGYCFRCHHYICDPCALVLKVEGECRPYLQRVEAAYQLDRLGIKGLHHG